MAIDFAGFLIFLTGLAIGLLGGLLIGVGVGKWLRARQETDDEDGDERADHETGAQQVILEAMPENKLQRTAPPAVTAAVATALANRVPKQPEASEGSQPFLYDAPSDGPADDLKKIRGIGPKYEQRLYALGVYYYSQISAWREEEIIWLDRALGFPGRISREHWQAQADALLKGVKTDFATRYDRGETPSSYS